MDFKAKNVSPVFNTALKTAVVLIAAVVVGVVLLLASFCLPDARILSHAKASVPTFNVEGDYPKIIDKTDVTTLDNFTDALMINTASFSSSPSQDNYYSNLEKALLNPRVNYENDQIVTL